MVLGERFYDIHAVSAAGGQVINSFGKHVETEREKLAKEVNDKKVQLEIPKVFKELRDEAKPTFILKKGMSETELVNEVKQSLKPESNSRSQ